MPIRPQAFLLSTNSIQRRTRGKLLSMDRIAINRPQSFTLYALFSILAACTTTLKPARPITGLYRLEFATDQAWHQHRMELTQQADSRRVITTLAIDRGIGPEARSPTTEETIHHAKTMAHWSGEALSLEVQIGTLEKTGYKFVLKPCTKSTPPICKDVLDWFGSAFIQSNKANHTSINEGIPVRLILEEKKTK